jgi:hypothetical protein
MNVVGRTLLSWAGLRDHVRREVEREQKRTEQIAATLETQLRQLADANAAVEERLRQLTKRYEDLLEKYGTAAEALERHRERFGLLKNEFSALKKAQLDIRVAALEYARRSDHDERLRALTSELESRFPLDSLATHAQQAIARSPLINDPYPHVVLDDVVPGALHAMLFDDRPPRGFWCDGQEGRQNWTIGEDLGPLRTESVWRFMDDVVVARVLVPQLATLFDAYLQTQNQHKGQRDRDRALGKTYERTGGRLMLRRPGYHFEPHLDPPRALLTGLFYFGRPEDGHDHGTKLLRSHLPIPDERHGVWYPLREGATCELVKVVPAKPNSMLVFASRVGLHGADIPADAQPSTLERYAYQFYIGERGRG